MAFHTAPPGAGRPDPMSWGSPVFPLPLVWTCSPALSPHLEGGGGGASRSPPHLPHCPRENHLHLQAASAPLPCLGKGSMPATSCQLGRGGGWNKDSAFILPNPQGGGLVGVGGGEGRREGWRMESPYRVSVGWPRHRWLPSDFQVETLGEVPAPPWLSDREVCQGPFQLSPSEIPGGGRAEVR